MVCAMAYAVLRFYLRSEAAPEHSQSSLTPASHSIALVCASESPGAIAAVLAQTLLAFKDKLYLFNPKHTTFFARCAT